MSSPRIGVCVLSYNAADTIEDCIRSVAGVPNASILLREHGERRQALEVAQAVAAEVGIAIQVSHDPTNPGFGAAMNSLAGAADCEWLFFLNPDAALLTWPWDEAGPPIGHLIGAIQVDSSGQRGRAYGRDYRVRDEIARSWLRRRPEPLNGRGFVGGAGLLIERAEFLALGGFDPSFFLFYEDIDLCLRAHDAGLIVALTPGFTIRHDTGTSTRRNWKLALTVSYDSGRRFHAKHEHSVRAFDAYVAVDAAGRSALDTVRRRTNRASAYRTLAARATANLLSRRRPAASS